MEGILHDREGVAADDLDNLACIAIRCWDSLDAVIDSIREKGRYDRSLCEYKELDKEVGVSKFDPVTQLQQGRDKCAQFRTMIQEFFKAPASKMMQSKKAKINHTNFKQGDMSMREFVTKDDRMARHLKQAGGIISDQTRIELVDRKISSVAREAMESYVSIQVALGSFDQDMYNNWLKYSDVLLQVCTCTEMDIWTLTVKIAAAMEEETTVLQL